jgi:hypothetical protein
MEDVGTFLAICYILRPFGILFPVLVCCNKKNLATLTTLVHTIGSSRLVWLRCDANQFGLRSLSTT